MRFDPGLRSVGDSDRHDSRAELRERGVGLRVIEQGIDTATAEGRAMFGMLSVLAELQRELIVTNTPRPPPSAQLPPGRGRPTALRRGAARSLQRGTTPTRGRTALASSVSPGCSPACWPHAAPRTDLSGPVYGPPTELLSGWSGLPAGTGPWA
ncbi:recombinase family protein [Plantactinospora sp. WMMB334]|uniref:recombinase family protein n=1 Tax=Plantactinospora sp. WMMB334 TaxID=3404119 RepID=UPI003B95F480